MLKLYTIFHLNLAYSSIEEERRPEVIRNCYWPLLELSDSLGIPIGIELSGYTLEQIDIIDREWIEKVRSLLQKKKLEIIGSGYSQIIGPLVPAEVNTYNQKFGLEIYKKILGVRPNMALVNEMAYSTGIIAHYIKSGYKAIIMEWDNPYRLHPRWKKKWRYYPQTVCDSDDNKIAVMWNSAIAFQKFQRYAHGEIDLKDYLDYLKGNEGKEERLFSLYGNDAEVFDYRPGRFHTEAQIHSEGEWGRIGKLFEHLKKDKKYDFISPSQALGHLKHPLAGNELHLESVQQPIPVKKQEKYNITRWAVTGADDTDINTECYRIYSYLSGCGTSEDRVQLKKLWKNLCYLWSSDFRTHIEQKRWQVFKKELSAVSKQAAYLSDKSFVTAKKSEQHKSISSVFRPRVENQSSKIKIETDKISIILNGRKGLAIDSLLFKDVHKKPLIGTIPHGYYDDIRFGADYFTGHTIIEESGNQKVTDLDGVKPVLSQDYKEGGDCISVACFMQNRLGSIKKRISVSLTEPCVTIHYHFRISLKTPASVRTGIITFIPRSFKRKSLYYETVNGGYHSEKFEISKESVNHSASVNRLISAVHCLGATEGWVKIGDDEKYIKISTNKAKMYSVPMIEYCNVRNSYFLRCYNSIRETDETSAVEQRINGEIEFAITAGKS